jgi:hypothetical protein
MQKKLDGYRRDSCFGLPGRDLGGCFLEKCRGAHKKWVVCVFSLDFFSDVNIVMQSLQILGKEHTSDSPNFSIKAKRG